MWLSGQLPAAPGVGGLLSAPEGPGHRERRHSPATGQLVLVPGGLTPAGACMGRTPAEDLGLL